MALALRSWRSSAPGLDCIRRLFCRQFSSADGSRLFWQMLQGTERHAKLKAHWEKAAFAAALVPLQPTICFPQCRSSYSAFCITRFGWVA